MAERKVLGRGLRALIPEAAEGKEVEPSFLLRMDKIQSNPRQPRQIFNSETLAELTGSIRKNGVVQPILVRPKGNGYEVVCGERRFRAAQAAGLTEIPAVVRPMSDEGAFECSIVENVQRSDLNPIEEAKAYQRLMNEFTMTQEKVADVVGKDRSSVANTIRLLGLPKAIQDELIRGRLTMGHARAILAVSSEAEQLALCKRILSSNLSVRETERMGRAKAGGKISRRDEAVRHVEEELQHLLGTKVRITDRKGKGKIVLEYFSPAERERLVRLLKERTRG
ncbi:MAG: ParB/RepB/Spo0J family partition protein [Candidatus Omnitrophica bacterium]|nr:ParB/RepB/Spo0J family partition protein [Candidatus Omnitrophota bacterium]